MNKKYQRFLSFGTIVVLLVGLIIFATKSTLNSCRNGYSYIGEIQKNQPVTMLLSCDLRTLKITGADTTEIQTIRADELPPVNGIHPDLVSNISHTDDNDRLEGEVQLLGDYNRDGHNDLEIVYSYGAGESQITQKSIFLYSPNTQLFVYHEQLSSLSNVYPDKKSGHIVEHIGLGYGTYLQNSFTLKGDQLQSVSEEECSLVDQQGNRIMTFEDTNDRSRYRQTVKTIRKGVVANTKITYFPYKEDVYSCLNELES